MKTTVAYVYSGLHVLVHCSMASEVVEIFPLFLYSN